MVNKFTSPKYTHFQLLSDEVKFGYQMKCKCRDGLLEAAFISGVSVTNIVKPSLSGKT